MKNQTQTQPQTASTSVVSSHEILKGLNVYPKRKTRAAKLTIAIKKQKDYIKSLAEGKAKQADQLVAVKQLIELVAARQVYLPKSQRITSLPTAQTILKDVLEVNPALAVSKPIKAEPSLTPVVRKKADSNNLKPQAKSTTKVENKPTKQDDTLVNLTKSIADLAKSVSDLTAIVTANSNAIAELQKTKSQPAPKAQPKAQPKAETKPTAKAEPKQTILKDFSALANCGLTFPTQSEQKPKADVQTELMARYFSFA